MKFLINFVFCSLCLNLTFCVKDQYRAAVVDSDRKIDLDQYVSFIQDAAKYKSDILLLPTPEESEHCAKNYDDAVKTISAAAKRNKIYVVAHLYERTLCQNQEHMVRSNLVFDRRGDVISVYRKFVNQVTNCTTSNEPPEFTTDFGVTFGLMMEEDLVLKTAGSLKNYIVAGEWMSEIPFLSSSQFSASWAYVTNANLITSKGIYAGRAGLKSNKSGTMSVAELNRNDGAPVVTPVKSYSTEDLDQYIMEPLDIEASRRGYKKNVCHNDLCCEFYIKTNYVEPSKEVGYSLAAFNGVRDFGGNHHIGVQSCALFACNGLNKRSCFTGLEINSTNITFETITISGNFAESNEMYPIIISPKDNPAIKFKFEKQPTKVTLEALSDLLGVGIFARDFTKDFESNGQVHDGFSMDIYEFLYSDGMKEFFDYVWIRLRVLLVIVSIYVLEMM